MRRFLLGLALLVPGLARAQAPQPKTTHEEIRPLPPPPPPVQYVERPEPVRVPRNALWLGGSLGVQGFGYAFYENARGDAETTGDFARTGLALELDLGVRLGKRHIPHLVLEVSGHPAGRRFDGVDAKAMASFLGVGFRYIALDVDTIGVAADLSFGFRTVSVSRDDTTFSMTSAEIFRLGLGLEIRGARRVAISPMLTLSGGTMNDTSGTVQFAPNQPDGLTSPKFQNGASIPKESQTTYLMVVIGCGVHFDLIGK